MKKYHLIASLHICIFIFSLSCSSKPDYSGKFKKISGKCINEYISIKKVKGFGQKYYLVIIHKSGRNKEFLGVIENNRITIHSGTRLKQKRLNVDAVITLYGKSLEIVTPEKRCSYKRVKDN